MEYRKLVTEKSDTYSLHQKEIWPVELKKKNGEHADFKPSERQPHKV